MSGSRDARLRRARTRWSKRLREVSRLPWIPWSLVAVLSVLLLVQRGTKTSLAVSPTTRTFQQGATAKATGNSHSGVGEAGPVLTRAAPRTDGKKLMCILQPILSRDREWNTSNLVEHIGYKAFMKSFAESIDDQKDANVAFRIYYGYDVTDKVLGNQTLRPIFMDLVQDTVKGKDVGFRLSPLYGLHGRITAIWNMMAKDAYAEGCDYQLMSNDDMLIFTKGWAGQAVHAMQTMPCPDFGIVRFVDEWASWAVFTFHISSRLHMEIFGNIYYPVPYDTTHNDYWIHFTYEGYNSSTLLDIHVRNRVKDNLKPGEAPARYKYDSKDGIKLWVLAGRAHVWKWYESGGNQVCPQLVRPRLRNIQKVEIL